MLKKKGISITIILSIMLQICIPIFTQEVKAATEEITATSDSRFTYIVQSDGTAEIIDYVGTDTELVIPSKLDGYIVTSIGSSAFWGCRSLTSIDIPESVTSIKGNAFLGCRSLTSIDIPESVTSIGGSVFRECSSLTSIAIPEGVTSIGSDVFAYCFSLTNIQIDENNKKYTSIEGVLYNKEKTELINYPAGKQNEYYIIPDGVTSISYRAFLGCSNLISINIPEGVTSIGNGAFEGCSSLTSIDIPASVTSIGRYAFQYCKSLSSIQVNENNNNYMSIEGVLYNKEKTELIQYPVGKQDEYYIIPEGVISIEDNAFEYVSNLTSIIIPEGVTSIESQAFQFCSNLTSVDIPKSVTSIGSSAFQDCKSLTNIDIPEGVTSIGNGAFDGCSSLTSIVIPEGVTTIESSTFDGCSRLTSIGIPEDVTSIGDYAFRGCISLTSIDIPEGVTTIESSTFEGCRSLISIDIPEVVTSIGERAFKDCSNLTSITIPEGVTSIGDSAFRGCISLTSIDIPEGVTTIESSTFEGCRSLISIDIPEVVTSIGERAFKDCSNLTSITIPEGVTSIGDSAFYNCNNINIICKENSIAEQYAITNKINYTIDNELPVVTYEVNGNTTPAKIQQTKVTVEDSISGVDENSMKYLWRQSEETPGEKEFTQKFTNGETISKKEGDGQWYLWILAEDQVGNRSIVKSNAFNLDNTAPEVEISQNPSIPTKEKVIVTITANEEIQEVEGWTLSENKQELTKEYTENTKGIEKLSVKDMAENEVVVDIEVTNIDNQAPTITYEGIQNKAKQQNIKITVEDTQSGVEESSLKYVWTTN